MEQINSMHKRRLYSLIIAGISFISLLLPWISISLGPFGSSTANGFHDWGYVTLLGVIGAAASAFMGDQKADFDDTFKKVALGSFAAIAGGALIFLLRLISNGGSLSYVGFGLWIALIVGVVGVLWMMGIVKLPDLKKGSGTSNPPPPSI